MSLDLFGFTFQAFGSPNELQIYAENQESAENTASLIINEVKRIERKYSRYVSDSVVSTINCSKGNPIPVDEETASLLNYAQECFHQSDSLFDITAGVLRRVWDFKEKKIPTVSELKTILPLIGWQKVNWEKSVIKLPEGMEIDFGGFGKEYAVDKLVSLCVEQGVLHGLVNLGDDVKVIGPHPDGTPWAIGIVHPRKEKEVLSAIKLFNGALATSGDYERYFEEKGRRYCHILNPKTGYPVEELQSVSVLSESCLIAGTATTICMLLGEKRGVKFLNELKLPALVVNKYGKVSLTWPELVEGDSP